MIFEVVFILSVLLLAAEDWLHGEIHNWKLWLFIGMNIVMSYFMGNDVPILYTLLFLGILLSCTYVLRMGGADTVVYAGISGIFPALFITVFISSLVAGQVAVRASKSKEIRFLPIITIALLTCLALSKTIFK